MHLQNPISYLISCCRPFSFTNSISVKSHMCNFICQAFMDTTRCRWGVRFITGVVRKRPNPHGKPPRVPITRSQRLCHSSPVSTTPPEVVTWNLTNSPHEHVIIVHGPAGESGQYLACARSFYHCLQCSEGARRLCTDAQTDLPGLPCIVRGSSSSKWRTCHSFSLVIVLSADNLRNMRLL
jgi:hypothetical protein